MAIHEAAELPAALRSAVESLPGRPIASQEISVVSLLPQSGISSEGRRDLLKRLEDFLDGREEETSDVPDGETESAIDQAGQFARSNRS